MINPEHHEEAWQGEGSDTRQWRQQQVQADNMPRLLQWHNRPRRRRRRRQQWRCRGKRYFISDEELGQQERERDLSEQDPCAASSSGCERQGDQCRCPVHGSQSEQPGVSHWRGHNQSRNQRQQQCSESFHLFWNVKKRCCVSTLHVPAATLREASGRLRSINMAGYCLPGMCAPHNTSQYIMEQHEYAEGNEEEEEAEAAMSRGSGNSSTASEDFPLMVPVPSIAQEDEGTSTEKEEEESLQPAHQD